MVTFASSTPQTRTLQSTLAKPAAEGSLGSAMPVFYDWSPDSKLVAVAYGYMGKETKSVPLFDVASGEVVRTLDVPSKTCRWVAFSPDGKTLSAAGEWAWGWDVTSGEVTSKTGPTPAGDYNSVAYSADGSLLALGNVWGSTICKSSVLPLQGLLPYLEVSGAGTHTHMAFADDDRTLVVARLGANAFAWNVKTGRRINLDCCFQPKGFTTGQVTGFAWSPDRQVFASTAADGMIRFFTPSDGRLLAVLTVLGHKRGD